MHVRPAGLLYPEHLSLSVKQLQRIGPIQPIDAPMCKSFAVWDQSLLHAKETHGSKHCGAHEPVTYFVSHCCTRVRFLEGPFGRFVRPRSAGRAVRQDSASKLMRDMTLSSVS